MDVISMRRIDVKAEAATLGADSHSRAAVNHAACGKGILLKWRLVRVVAFIDDHISETITLADMARAAGLSRMHFAAQFRATTGLRPHEYLLRCRISWARHLLAQSNLRIAEIAMNTGFQSQAHFTTVFRRFVGNTPRRWRRSLHEKR